MFDFGKYQVFKMEIEIATQAISIGLLMKIP